MVSRDLDSPVVSSTTNPATPSHFGSPASALSGINMGAKDDISSAMSSSSDSEMDDDDDREDSVGPAKPIPSHISHPIPGPAQVLGAIPTNLMPPTTNPLAGVFNGLHAISTANSFQMH